MDSFLYLMNVYRSSVIPINSIFCDDLVFVVEGMSYTEKERYRTVIQAAGWIYELEPVKPNSTIFLESNL